MSYVVERVRSALAHVALCADVTWAAQPHDDFILANQRLWTQHVRVTQALQDSAIDKAQSYHQTGQCGSADKHENASSAALGGSGGGGQTSRRSVKDVIPESRLTQFYGTFFYDDYREKCYTDPSERLIGFTNGHGFESSDLTECWMLPEVEYWFRKLTDDPEASQQRRQVHIAPDDDLCVPCASERWGPQTGDAAEEALRSRVRGVRALWPAPAQPAHHSPPAQRKMRVRRRTPRRAPHRPHHAPPTFCPDAPAPLICDPNLKFQFDPPQPPRSQLSPYVEDFRSKLTRPTVPTGSRPVITKFPVLTRANQIRYGVQAQRNGRGVERRYTTYNLGWPRELRPVRTEISWSLPSIEPVAGPSHAYQSDQTETKSDCPATSKDTNVETDTERIEDTSKSTLTLPAIETVQNSSPRASSEANSDDLAPTISATAQELASSRKKRLYSTVLSTGPPPPLNLSSVGRLRLSQKLVSRSALLKLNPKLAFSVNSRKPFDTKFEELEREALEQYKASDESIDSKFRDLEDQAMEQYSGTSNSNTSCSSGQSGNSKGVTHQCVRLPPIKNDEEKKPQPAKFPDEKTVDSVVIYSQHFPDLATKSYAASTIDLKNFHTPQRGEKKEVTHRPAKNIRNNKHMTQRAASDTDNDSRESKKVPLRWTLHMIPPKKRHLSICVSDFSSDEDKDSTAQPVRKKDMELCIKPPSCAQAASKVKMSAHGGGDLHPTMRKT